MLVLLLSHSLSLFGVLKQNLVVQKTESELRNNESRADVKSELAQERRMKILRVPLRNMLTRTIFPSEE